MDIEQKPKRQKTGGRVADTPNRITRETREVLKTIVEGYFPDKFWEDFYQLDFKDRVSIMEKLLKYIVPTQTQTSITMPTMLLSEMKMQIEVIDGEQVVSLDDYRENINIA